jgi:hypothetical protein
MEVLRPSENLVNICQTAGLHIPEDYFLRNNSHENLKFKTDYDVENHVMNIELKES